MYLAIFVPEGNEPLPRKILEEPRIKAYIQDFGTKSDDHALFAVQENKIVGAVWVRVLGKGVGYGYVDDQTPEFAMSVVPEYRGHGIGNKLLQGMFSMLRKNGYQKVSLSVQKENKAFEVYKKAGFTVLESNEKDFIMVSIL